MNEIGSSSGKAPGMVVTGVSGSGKSKVGQEVGRLMFSASIV